MRISGWISNNFRGAAGGSLELLPSIRLFLPGMYDHTYWTMHFCFLLWTVGVHFYPRDKGFVYRTIRRWTHPHKHDNKRKQFSLGRQV